MAVFKNVDGKWVASYNGTKQYFSSKAEATRAYEAMKSGKTGTTAPTAPRPTPTPVPPTPTPSAPSSNYRPLDASFLSQISARSLGPGMTNDPNQVKALQQALVNAGYMSATDMATGPGTYGPKTTAAVALWQKTAGIDTSGNPGYFGPISMNAIKTGVNSAGNPISGSQTRDQSNPTYDDTIPSDLGIPESAVNTTVGMMPQEGFGALSPRLKPGTPEYEKAMDELSTAYFDVMQQQLTAQTEQEQQVANTSWMSLKKEIENTLNVTLSNDAIQAWDQIEGLRSQGSERNISGSGIEAESMDDYLKKIRANDSVARTSAQSKEEEGKMSYYTKFATPEEVNELVRTNRKLAESWGLVPSDEIRTSMTVNALKKAYPTLSDDEIEAYRASMFDDNGNYRSSIYQRQMTGNSTGINPGNPDAANAVVDEYGNIVSLPFRPGDTGILDIQAAKDQYQSWNTPLAAQRDDYEARQSFGAVPTTPLATSGANTSTRYTGTTTPYTGTITPVNKTTTPTTTNTTKPPATITPPKTTTPTIRSNSISGGTQVGLTQDQINKLSPAMRKTLGY